MTFATKKLPDSRVELTINLEKKDLLMYIAKAEEYLGKQVKLEGFRPGKAPKEVVRPKINEHKVREEALRIAIQSSLIEVLAKEGFDVIEQLDFKIRENSAEKLVYQTIFLIFPDFKLGNYKGFEIRRRNITVNESEIREVVSELLDLRTVFNEVKRPARNGDRVEVDFTIKYKGNIIDGGKSENHPVVLGKGRFTPGFEDHLVGMKKGETRHFTLKIPDDFYQKNIAGKILDFEVVMKKIEDRVVPRLDDDFARSLGNFNSLEELKASIKQGLTMEKEMKEKDRVRLAILTEIASRTKVKVPEILIERRLEEMIQDLDSELHQKGMEFGLYLAQLKKTRDELKRDWRLQAELQVKMGLITKAIAKAEGLRVSEEEVNEELEIVLQRYVLGKEGMGIDKLGELDIDELRKKIRDTLLNEKVLEFLERQNVVA
jgi:trigger factor